MDMDVSAGPAHADRHNLLCECVVCDLQIGTFSVRSFSEQQAIVINGRPTPHLTLTKSRKKFRRHFRSSVTDELFCGSVYNDYQWLTGCKTISKLFCWPCLLFSSMEKTKWNTSGFSNLNKLHKMVKIHRNTKCHLKACFTLKRFGVLRKEQTLDNPPRESQKKHNELVRKNREVMKRLIDITCFLGQHQLNERETNEDLLNLLAKYDPVLSNHLEQSTVFQGRIENDVIKSIANVVLNTIKTEIARAKYVSIIMDEIKDTTNSQLAAVLRYVTNDGLVQERFVGLTCITSDRSTDQTIKDILKFYGCDWKLIAQISYDSATVMSKELKKKVKETFKKGVILHCFAHRLIVVLSQSLSQINDCKVFFTTLNGIAAFFSKATKKTLTLDEHIKKRFPEMAPISWKYNGRLVETVYKHRQSLIDFFQVIVNDRNWDAETINSSRGYLDLLSNDLNFNFLLGVFASIFPYTDVLSDILQTEMNNIDYCVAKINEFQNKILEKTEQFDDFWQKTEQLNVGVQRKWLRIGDVDDVQASNKRLFIEIIDNISAQLKDCSREFGDMKFLELVNFCNREDVPEEASTCFKKHYGNIFDMAALQAQLSALYDIPEINNIQNCANVLMFLKQNELTAVYDEVCRLCELVLTLPATSASAESSFSILKRIKHFVHNSAGDERLSNLAVISIERDLIKTLSQRQQFYDDILDEFLKQKRCPDLIYQ